MISRFTPMRWPAGWRDPSALALLHGTPVNFLLTGEGVIAAEAARRGLSAGAIPPAGVRMAKGEWPGIQMGKGGSATAGPTGAPWLESNGWRIRLDRVRHPDAAVWIDAAPKTTVGGRESYASAYADAAAFGGRWIISLDEATAAGIAAGNARALAAWNRLITTVRFFDRHAGWEDYAPKGVLGVVSDFAGDNEFLAGETLNLLARGNQQCRLIRKDSASAGSWGALRALLYVDSQPPAPELKRQIEDLVYHGRMLIAGPQWGRTAGTPDVSRQFPRYELLAYGKGKIALAKAEPGDPYVLANDAVLLMSRRYELVRFFNVGAVSSYLTSAPDGRGDLLQMMFYTGQGPRDASVWTAGRYRSARLWNLDGAAGTPLETHPARSGVELHLPPVSEYAAVELEL